MKPSKANLRDRAGAASDDNARVTGECHDQISCVAHSTRNNHRCRPVRWRHVGVCDDADDQPASSLGALRGYAGRRTAASADHGNSQSGKQLPRISCQVVCPGSGLCTSQHTNLRPTDASSHLCPCACTCRRLRLCVGCCRSIASDQRLSADGQLLGDAGQVPCYHRSAVLAPHGQIAGNAHN